MNHVPINAYQSLTPKHKVFVDQYIILNNGRQAAIKAGYSITSAHSTAYDILNRAYIKQAMKERLEEISKIDDLRLTPDKIRSEIAKIAYDKQLKPDTRLKGLELAGKATAGTFDVVKESGDTFNFLSLISGRVDVAPSLPIPPVVASMPILEKSSIIDTVDIIPLTKHNDMHTIDIESSPVVDVVKVSPIDNVAQPETLAPPQPPRPDIDTLSQKIVAQKSNDAHLCDYTVEQLQAELDRRKHG